MLPRREHGLHGGLAHVLDGGQAESNAFPVRRERVLARVDIGREDIDPHVAALVQVENELVLVAHFRAQQGRHELDRIVRLQVGRLVGDERVSRGVRFVEPVARELFHEIEELLRFGRRHAVPARASQKFLAHRHHVLVFLLAHGAPQDVRFTQTEPGDAGGNLDHLLLINDHAVSFLENLLELRQVVGHPLAAQLARDEIGPGR